MIDHKKYMDRCVEIHKTISEAFALQNKQIRILTEYVEELENRLKSLEEQLDGKK